MKQLQQNDLIYLAGFIDGNGSIMAQLVARPDNKLKYQIRFTIQITQLKKRSWILEQFKDLIGAGYIKNRNEISDFVLVETANVYNLLKQLQPFLKLKKKQANLVLKIIEQLPSSKNSSLKFYELCKLVDQVAALNDEKSRVHTAETVAVTLKELKKDDVPVETSD